MRSTVLFDVKLILIVLMGHQHVNGFFESTISESQICNAKTTSDQNTYYTYIHTLKEINQKSYDT